MEVLQSTDPLHIIYNTIHSYNSKKKALLA